MLMNNLSRLAMSLPFRKWVIDEVVKKHFREYFQQLNGGVFLEIGCGNGAGAKTIKKYFSPKKIIATDLDPFMIKVAKLNVYDPSIVFEVEDATKLKYKLSNLTLFLISSLFIISLINNGKIV